MVLRLPPKHHHRSGFTHALFPPFRAAEKDCGPTAWGPSLRRCVPKLNRGGHTSMKRKPTHPPLLGCVKGTPDSITYRTRIRTARGQIASGVTHRAHCRCNECVSASRSYYPAGRIVVQRIGPPSRSSRNSTLGTLNRPPFCGVFERTRCALPFSLSAHRLGCYSRMVNEGSPREVACSIIRLLADV